MYKRILFFLIIFLFTSISNAECPSTLADKLAINIAEKAMNEWFTAVQKSDIETIKMLLSPKFIILHSQGKPLTRAQELKLLKGFELGGYHFSDFCAMRVDDTIIATFASKTYKKDISQSHMNFLSKSKAYRLLVMKKTHGKWLIIAYANTNPITIEKEK